MVSSKASTWSAALAASSAERPPPQPFAKQRSSRSPSGRIPARTNSATSGRQFHQLIIMSSPEADTSRTATGFLAILPWSRPFPFRLLDQLFQGLIQDLRAGRAAHPLVPDHALVIEDVERRQAGQVPPGYDGPLSQGAWVSKRPPGQLLLVHRLLQLLGVVAVDVDADQGEGPVLQLLDERPLVGPMAPSGESLLMPKVE